MNDVSSIPLAANAVPAIPQQARPVVNRLRELRIAVVIPLYNGGKFIQEAIESVLNQTLPPAEFIVVDDGSTDNGPEIVAGMAARHPIRLLRKANGGQASARNFGIAHTTSEFIALLDQDDAWYSDHLEQLVRPFLAKRSPKLGWVYGNLDEVDEAGGLVARSMLRFGPSPHPKRDLFECLSSDMFVLPSATIIAREAFDAVGGFDERLAGYEDDDLFLRIFRAGFDNVFINRGMTRWRIFGGSASYSPRMAVSRMIYFRKLLEEYPDDPAHGRFYAKNYLAPRFFPWMAHQYMNALRHGGAAEFTVALQNLQFVTRRHKPRARIVMALMLPVLRWRFLAKLLMPLTPGVRPLIRRLLR